MQEDDYVELEAWEAEELAYDALTEEEKEEDARLEFAMQCCGGMCSWCGG